MNAIGLAPLLLLFPAVGVALNALFGRKFVESDRTTGERWTGWFASIMALAAFGVAVLLFLSLYGGQAARVVPLFEWIRIPAANFSVPWALQVDSLSVTMMLVVTGVGSLIHIYAIGYMHGDEHFARFFTYMNLFLFFMLILVSADNYLMLFVGWEGVGLCSFLLIGFWFGKSEKGKDGVAVGILNSNAARKAFVANRVGDFAVIIAMILTFWAFGSLRFQPVFDHALEVFEHEGVVTLAGTGIQVTIGGLLTAITTLFLIGAAGKSAQIPLFIWLPDAMAGPTPVSALIHAATMVTSGIYLLVRSNVLLEITRVSGYELFGWFSSPTLIALIGASTALYAGLKAFTQFDIKKVLAYSTVSQLGFMIAAAGMGAYVAAMFHLVNHAFFKALLFLGSGSAIHGMEHGHHSLHDHGHHGDAHGHADPFDPQDMRYMGGLRQQMPLTFVVYLVGALALAGIVPLAGFWSKDEILAHAAANSGTAFTLVSILLTLAAVCTAFYMGRQLKMTFFGAPRHAAAQHAHESPPVMIRPLIVLALLSIFGGVLNVPYFSEGAESAETAHAAETHAAGLNLALEHWLEPSIPAFHLTEEGALLMPHTPTTLQLGVAGLSTLLAVAALAASTLVVYRDRPQRADEPDPLQSTPIWWMARLPLNTFVMQGLVPIFNRFADWLAHTVDWAFWHDFFHERLIRDPFIGLSRFTSNILDANVLDNGLVLGVGRLVRGVSGALRQIQTGYVRNYALTLFLGVVALLAYFLFFAG